MFKSLLKILIVVFIFIMAFYFPSVVSWIGQGLQLLGLPISTGAISAAASLAASLPWWAGAAIGLGLSYLIAPEATASLVKDIANGVQDIVDTGLNLADGVVTSVASTLFGNPVFLVAAGVGLYLLTRDRSGGPDQPRAITTSTAEGAN